MQSEFGSENFTVIGVMEGDSQDAEKFISELDASYPILAGAEASFDNWGVTMLPQAYLINPEGRVVADGIEAMSEILRAAL